MVGAAGHVERHAGGFGDSGAVERALQNAHFPLHQRPGKRKTNGAHLAGREFQCFHARPIIPVVRLQDHFFRNGLRGENRVFSNSAFVEQLRRNQLVFQHWKAVAFGQRVGVDGVVGDERLDHRRRQ